MRSIFSDRDRNSEVCAQALLPKLGCFNNEDDEAHLLFFFSFFFRIPIFAFKSKNCLLLLTSCNRFREKNYNQTSGDALQHELSIVSHMNSNCKII